QHAAWTGLGVGALVGILFPPSIIASGVVGAATGGLIGHLWGGMSRADVKEIGELLDEGEAGLVVIGTSKVEEQVAKALERAQRQIAKELNADSRELEKHLSDAAS
ncbi:MAG: DUF1269 domain-containing protein, partial [Solirubrobacterales bacterium]|nr:DUF1269 domain-containing protein [Solirubrobacterales bacterium]